MTIASSSSNIDNNNLPVAYATPVYTTSNTFGDNNDDNTSSSNSNYNQNQNLGNTTEQHQHQQHQQQHKRQEIHHELHCLSLYNVKTSKILLQPFYNKSSDVNFTQQLTSSCSYCGPFQINPNYKSPNCCRIKFEKLDIWMDYQAWGVQARQTTINLIKSMKQHYGKELLISADITRAGASAETLFFTNISTTNEPEIMACIMFSNYDKIRYLYIPEQEQADLEMVIKNVWKQGIVKCSTKYGAVVYQLHGHPWATVETSNKDNLESRLLIMGMLQCMYNHGWTKVIPVDCCVTDNDLDSLIFYRSGNSAPTMSSISSSPIETCCLSLERHHKMRLIGTRDQITLDAFEQSIPLYWTKGIYETHNKMNTKQVKMNGHPWLPYNHVDYIASAQLVCGVLESLYRLGWEWHCAMDVSRSPADKSTIFLKRLLFKQHHDDIHCQYKDDNNNFKIGGLQVVERSTINLVRFPSKLLQETLTLVKQTSPWIIKRIDELPSKTSASIKFEETPHHAHNTQDKTKQGKFYLSILPKILNYHSGVQLLGCADISARTTGGDNPSSLDGDIFLFHFNLNNEKAFAGQQQQQQQQQQQRYAAAATTGIGNEYSC